MEKWIARGRKISLGIYVLLGVIGIGYIVWGVYDSGYEWTKGHTINAITLFGMLYVLMALLIRVVIDRKLTKKILLLEIPLAIVVTVGLIATLSFVEEQKIPSLASLLALMMSTPLVVIFVQIGYRQWNFYSKVEVLLEKGGRK